MLPPKSCKVQLLFQLRRPLPDPRLMEFLNELCKDYGYNCDKSGDQVIKHPYTQKDIASLIGVSRPTLNVLLNELKAENSITFNRGEIRLLN